LWTIFTNSQFLNNHLPLRVISVETKKPQNQTKLFDLRLHVPQYTGILAINQSDLLSKSQGAVALIIFHNDRKQGQSQTYFFPSLTNPMLLSMMRNIADLNQ